MWDKFKLFDRFGTLERKIGLIIHAGLWSILGSVFARFFLLLTGIIVSRTVGVEEYGLYTLAQSTVNMFCMFATFGLGLSATKFTSEYYLINKDKVSSVIVTVFLFCCMFSIISTVALYYSANFISIHFYKNIKIKEVLELSAILIFFISMSSIIQSIMMGLNIFKVLAFLNFIFGFISLICVVNGVFVGSVNGAVNGLIIANIINFLFLIVFLNRIFKKNEIKIFKNIKLDLKMLWGFSFPVALGGLMVGPVNWLSVSYLARTVTDGLTEVAFYNIAMQWNMLILFIPSALAPVIIAKLSALTNKNQPLMKQLCYTSVIYAVCTLLPTLFIVLFSVDILAVYGKDFYRGEFVLIIMSFAAVISAINMAIGQIIMVKNKAWHGFILNMIWGVMVLMFSYLFIPKYKAEGLAFAYLSAYILHTIFQYLYLVFYLRDKLDVEKNKIINLNDS